jgi:CDP-diacylglycerol--serine O-phosphatidyltransferase
MAVFETIEPTLVIVNTLLIAGLMISRVPMFSFKKVRVRRHAVPFLMVLIGMFVLAMFRDAWLTLSVAVWTYIAMIPLSVLSHKRVVQQLRSVESGAVVQGAAL